MTQTQTTPILGRKFWLGIIGVGAVVALAIGSELLKRYTSIDVSDVIKWAMGAIATMTLGTQSTIAYEDARRPSAP